MKANLIDGVMVNENDRQIGIWPSVSSSMPFTPLTAFENIAFRCEHKT